MIRAFPDLSMRDSTIAGGKGASLGEMTRAGFPIPPGFVVLAEAFDRFLDEADLRQEIEAELAKCDKDKMHTIERGSERIQKMILEARMPIDIEAAILKSYATLSLSPCLRGSGESPSRGGGRLRSPQQKNGEQRGFFVAVRSSATAEDSQSAAWAGQLDSFLNTTEETLLENIQRCWASLFTPRAIFYRMEQLEGLGNRHACSLRGNKESETEHARISVAVVVQTMIQSEISGIAFSVHPVTEDPDQLIIEAGWGLGEAIVSGTITPDSYVVSKKNKTILDTNTTNQETMLVRHPVSPPVETHCNASLHREEKEESINHWIPVPASKQKKQKLTDAQILELSEIIIRIESHYGFPCDIEWAFADGKFYIVQSRPITTLAKSSDPQEYFGSDTQLRDDWVKVWTTEYSLFSIWSFGRQYIEWCKKEIGMGFNEMIFLIEGDLATAFRVDRQQREFAYHFAILSLTKDSYAQENIVNKLLALKGDLYTLMNIPLNTFLTKECLEKFILAHNTFLPYFLVPLWSVNEFEKIDVQPEVKEQIFKIYEDVRKEIEHVYPDIEKFLQRIFEHIANKTGYNKKYLRALLPDELLTYVNTGALVAQKILINRYDYSVVVANVNGNILETGKGAYRHIERILPKIEIFPNEEITGVVAQAGVARGRVRKLFMGKDLLNFQEGEIFVTTMTRPEWLSVMTQAVAFVTDVGGLLCHAAIASRELKKPCIIGTKIATQVLHDGDLVEVDANAGVVRILERARK